MAIVYVLLLWICAKAYDEECSHCAADDTALLQAKIDDRQLKVNSSRVVLRLEDTMCFMTERRQEASLLQAKGSTRSSGVCDWNPRSVEDLAKKYDEIFAEAQRNRNAASHLWATFIIQRSHCLSHEQIIHMFGGFCAVSGSPLGEPSSGNRFKQELSLVAGGTKIGYSYHCCWPCFCDEKDVIKVDTKTLKDKSGSEKQYFFEVIGNPCKNSPPVCTSSDGKGCIPAEAPGVKCENGKLKGAILSDKGHPIIGMFFVDAAGIKNSIAGDEKKMQSEDGSLSSLQDACRERKASGTNSGMGKIFLNVAKLNPL